MLYGLTGWHVMVVLSFWIVPFVLWLIALVQIAKSKAAAGPVVAWVVLVTLIPLVGAIVWFAIGRRSLRESGPGDRVVG
ncbi:PLD nuclease N-terminal domain-containing protein [Leifsonia sp. P73]|uniref:PLD nuclease N-terminal domain-containing protein n=1 Tax=Leifsonia sp. P73 TaxID=3423959 RepID=UPI003DA319FB